MRRLPFVVSLLAIAAARSQVDESTPGWFAFDIPGLEAATGSPVDLSALNAEPVGAHGRLRVQDGHFVDGRGQRVRMIGTNITGDSCFMDPQTADHLAKRLRQWGFNCLRLHFMDFSRKGSIWEDPATGEVSEEQLQLLDHLIDACARNGIYINLNLHVAAEYADQPKTADNRAFRMGKSIDRWYEPCIAAQERYARALLNHRSAVRNVRWADDPAISVIEINNENTWIKEARRNYRLLPDPWASALRAKWTDWLRAKYGTTEALRKAWGKDVQPLGMELVGTNWKIERAGGAESTLQIEDGIIRWNATKAGTAFWHLQMQYPDLHLPPGRYTCGFRARSRTRNTISHVLMLNRAPWTSLGLNATLDLTPEWQHFTITTPVVAPPVEGSLRLNISLSNKVGEVEIADYSLRPGGGRGLPENQTLETGVGIPDEGMLAEATDDWFAFLIDTETATTKRLVRLLKEELGCKAPISDTQTSYGGVGGILRDTTACDYIDMHGYWEHPHYARDERGRTIAFRIPNTAQVSSPAGGTLGNLACYRVKGFPFAVSEYNIPAPNDHAASLFPLLAAMAATQDWDALYSYTYRDFGKHFEDTRIRGHFHLIGRANLLVHVPAAVRLFRQNALAPARTTTTLVLPLDQAPRLVRTDYSLRSFWSKQGADMGSAWFRRIETEPVPTGEPAVRNPFVLPDGPRIGGPVSWHPTEEGGAWFSLNTPTVRLLVGHVGGRRVEVGDATFTVADRPWPKPLRAYACVSLTALDGRPVAESKRLLLASSARTENTNMKWSEERTSLAGKDAWGGASTVSEAVPLVLNLPGTGFRARALDAQGRPGKSVTAQDGTLRLDADDRTLWVLIER